MNNIKGIFKLFSENIIRKFSGGHKAKMVRYFPNTFDDYKDGEGSTEVDSEAIKAQINEYVQVIANRLRPTRKNVDGGLYIGITGVSFMFYCLAKNPLLSDKKDFYMQKAMEYMEPAMETSAGDKTSFLLGDAGTYALATVLKKEEGDEGYAAILNMYKTLYNIYLQPKFLKCGGDEFFVGRAGYIAGILWLNRELKSTIFPAEDIYKMCDLIIASGRDYSQRHNSACPLMYHYYNTEYIGAAHGIAFILQMLISVPGYLEYNKSAATDIKSTIEFLASLQSEEGNWPSCMEEIGLDEHKLVHWCHGAPGIIYLMGKAFLVFKDDRFYNACIRAGEVVWNKGLLRKGPGICHGVAGSGYAFLMLYRLTNDPKYLYRAKVFADFMADDKFLQEARVPDNPESLYEGVAGTVCFLSDLLTPDKAEFPFQDVFQ